MKYILCVDKQPQINPSEDIRKYTFEIEELKRKGDTYDTLIIDNVGNVSVIRRITLIDGEPYKLDEEIIEEVENIDIELFDGINYLYLQDIQNLSMTLDYVLKNDTFDFYPTSSQMRSAITQSATSIEISVNAQLEGIRVESIKSVDVEYALGLSSQIAPTTGWDTVAPQWENGKYMWQRTKTTYVNDREAYSEPTCISGAKGEAGTNGKGITNIEEYYAVSSSNSTPPADNEFSTTFQTMTSTDKYLWNFEIITYTDNTTERTIKRVIGVYGDKGTDGTDGDDGVGISSIVNKYQISSSNIEAPTTWLDNPPAMTNTDKYLWNYEIVNYTNNTSYSSTPSVIGVYGDKGTDGTDGDDGVGVLAIAEQYYLSTSNTSQTGGSWKDTQDPWVSGKYIWTRNKITWTDNRTTYTTPILATGINKANETANDVSEDLSQNYSTTVQMNAAITTKANEINSVVATKVGKNEVISEINQTSELIKILANRLALEGYTTINGGFAVDTNGNASIANGAVVIDNTGIKMADNTQIVGGNGLMTNLFFPSVGQDYWKLLGIMPAYWEYWTAEKLTINYSIPQGFTPLKAYITIIEKPVYWDNAQVWGYPRKIGVFKEDLNPYIVLDYAGDFSAGTYPEAQLTQIFDNNADTWTPTAPSDNSHDTQVKITKDLNLSDFIAGSNGTLFVKPTELPTDPPSVPATALSTGAERTGIGDAYLNVVGFMSF